MNPTESNCQHLKVLDERITRERELREALESKLDERDKRYEQRFDSQDKFNAIVSLNAKEAVSKSEVSQTVYNQTHNDLTRKMDAQYKEMVPRTEADSKFKALEEKIADLRESRSLVQGRTSIATVLWSIFGSLVVAVTAGLVIYSITKK